MVYKPTIGLEIHIELNTKSKMFCSCKNDSKEKTANLNICPICLGHPGTLPVINKEAVKKVIKTAQALDCKIEKRPYFERKNYFYPDLPKGYQISQYALPLSRNGHLVIPIQGKFKKIAITRIHLEEDTGRLIHPEGKDYSLVDFNRAGIPLMELVTDPDIESSREAKEFVRQLQLILRYLEVSTADMEKGEMRCEVNVSLMRINADQDADKRRNISVNQSKSASLGTKVEIKNLNSLRTVEKAIEYEIERQKEILEEGGKIIQETRGWHDKKELTFSQREKEESHDYRYLPEPDLPPLEINEEFLERIRSEIPELPFERRQRFKRQYFLSEKEIEIYVFQKDLGEYFEKIISELRNWVKEKKFKEKIEEEEFKKLIKLASNYISTDLQGLLKGKSFEEERFPITPENFAEFISMIYLGEISSKIAKTLLKEMFDKGKDPSQIIESKGLKLINNKEELEKAALEVISKNQKAVNDYKKGKTSALQFLIGKIMSLTKGKASPETAREILKKLLLP